MKPQPHIPQDPHPGHTGCIPKPTGEALSQIHIPSPIPHFPLQNWNETQIQNTLKGETEAAEPSSGDRRSQGRGPRETVGYTGEWPGPPWAPGSSGGCRRPLGAASGKVSVLPAPLPPSPPDPSVVHGLRPRVGEGTSKHNGPELSQVRGEGEARAGPRETRAAPVAPERPRSRPSISEVGRAGTRESPDSIGDASMVTKAERRRSRPKRLTTATRSRLRRSLRGPFVRGSVYAGPAR